MRVFQKIDSFDEKKLSEVINDRGLSESFDIDSDREFDNFTGMEIREIECPHCKEITEYMVVDDMYGVSRLTQQHYNVSKSMFISHESLLLSFIIDFGDNVTDWLEDNYPVKSRIKQMHKMSNHDDIGTQLSCDGCMKRIITFTAYRDYYAVNDFAAVQLDCFKSCLDSILDKLRSVSMDVHISITESESTRQRSIDSMMAKGEEMTKWSGKLRDMLDGIREDGEDDEEDF